MTDTIANSEEGPEGVARLDWEAAREKGSPGLSFARKISELLRKGFRSRDVLQAAADHQAIIDSANILSEPEQKEIGKLKRVAEFLFEQRGIFALMAVPLALELVKKFTDIHIPYPLYEGVKHGANAGIGALIMPAGEGRPGSKVARKVGGAVVFAAGVHGAEKVSHLPGSLAGLVDDAVGPFVKIAGRNERVADVVSKVRGLATKK